MNKLLAFVDKLLRIETPPVFNHHLPNGELDGELANYYKEIHGDMRSIRDTELKFIAIFFQILAFLFAGNLIVISSTNPMLIPQLRFLIGLSSIIFLLFLWLSIHARIAYDHKSYSFLMARKAAIDKHWYGEVFSSKPSHLGSASAGIGYRKSQSLVALSVIFTSVFLVVCVLLTLPPLPW